jgi:hypothetical protein
LDFIDVTSPTGNWASTRGQCAAKREFMIKLDRFFDALRGHLDGVVGEA